MNKVKHDWTKVHGTLLKYFSTRHQRDAMLNSVETDEDFDAYEAADKAALLVVQEAFHKVTSAVNTLERCMMVDAWEIARSTRYDITVHFPNAKKPEPKKDPEPFDYRRVFGW
jgi:hypothetical protein